MIAGMTGHKKFLKTFKKTLDKLFYLCYNNSTKEREIKNMEKLKNGIYATAMDLYIKEMYEELEDEEQAELLMNDWLQLGVPDGNTLSDNINDFGVDRYFQDLHNEFIWVCKNYNICPNYSKKVEEIKENIVKMLDNTYYFVV